MAAAVPILAAATPVSGTAVPAGPDATTLGFHIISACIGMALPSRDPKPCTQNHQAICAPAPSRPQPGTRECGFGDRKLCDLIRLLTQRDR